MSRAQTSGSPNAQVASQTRLTLAIGLTMHDRAGLDAYITTLHDPTSPNYQQWLTPVQIANQFGPSQVDHDALVAWLQGQGIRITQTFNHRLLIMASTTADVASQVFGVSFGTYTYNNQTFVAAANEPSIPAQFSGIVSSITGLDTYYGLTGNHAHRDTPVGQANPNSLSSPYTPGNIKTAYNLPVFGGSGVAMAVLSACEASTTDLNGFTSRYTLTGFTLNTNYFRVAVNSKGDGSDPPIETEPTLDVEWSHAMAPGAKLYFYYDNNVSNCGNTKPPPVSWTFSGTIATAAKVLSDNLVQTWSLSWGCSEDNCWPSTSRTNMDTVLKSMVAAGMTGFVATGDAGAYAASRFCTGSSCTLDVQFPASDPNIVAVGGTTLTINNDGSYGAESAFWCVGGSAGCAGDGGNFGGGGGNSVIYTKPSWQSGVAGVSKTGRGVPDVSLDMDFHYPFYYGGSIITGWGGTSFAAPEWNGIMATIISTTTQPSTIRFGNINYLLYSATSNPWTAIRRDVTTGANGYTSSCGGSGQPQCGYSADSGWDYATGWGSLNGIPAVSSAVTLPTGLPSGPAGYSVPTNYYSGVSQSCYGQADSAHIGYYIPGAEVSRSSLQSIPSPISDYQNPFSNYFDVIVIWNNQGNEVQQVVLSPMGSVNRCDMANLNYGGSGFQRMDIQYSKYLWGPPRSVTATAASSTQINLAWTSNTGGAETSFGIERATSSSGPFVGIISVGSGVNSFQDTGLSPGTTYYYQVRAYSSFTLGDVQTYYTKYSSDPLGDGSPASATTIAVPVVMTVSYSIKYGGNPTSPSFHYVLGGVQKTYTLTTTPTGVSVDGGSQWSVYPNPLSGSSGSERWESNQALSSTATTTTINFVFDHQYYLTVIGGNNVQYSVASQTGDNWYDAGTAPVVSSDGVYSRSVGTGQRVSSWKVDTGASTSVATTGTVSTSAVTMNAPHTVTFTSVIQYQLTLTPSPVGAGTATASTSPPIAGDMGWYDSGAPVSISATRNPGYSFSFWTGTGSGSCSGLCPSGVTMNGPITEIANFLRSTSISFTVSPSSISVGSSVGLSGSITPTPGAVQVTLSLSVDSGSTWASFITVMTDGTGSYSIGWTPAYPSNYLLKAGWSGNSQFAGSTSSSASLTVTGSVTPTPTLLLSNPSTASQGQLVALSITVFNPTRSSLNANVTVQITGPGNYVSFNVIQVQVGASSQSTTYYDWTVPSQPGAYTVTVQAYATKPGGISTGTIQPVTQTIQIT